MGKIQLRIAIWSGQKSAWGKTFLGSATADNRLKRLAEVVGFARTQWLDVGDSSGLPVLKIFVAPESTLTKSEEERAFAFSELQWKNARFTDAFVDLSQGLLLIPGTAIWKKPLVKETPSTVESLEPVKLKHEGLLKEYHQRQLSYYKEKGYSESGQRDTANLGLRRLQKKLTTIQGRWSPSSTNIYIARNVAYVYLDGKKLLKYYKQSEDKLNGKTQEVHAKDKDAHTDIKFIPGHQEGSFDVNLEEIGTLHCGLEICVDHTGGQLKFSEGGKNVHLQFLLSDVSYLNKNSLSVRPGGYLVHACTAASLDTERGVSGLYDDKGTWINTAEWHTMVDSELLCYSVELTV